MTDKDDWIKTYIQTGVRPKIDEFGWMCQAVFHPEGDKSPFCYTIGLTEQDPGHPEFIVFAIAPPTAHTILTTFANRVMAGEKFQDGQELEGIIEGYPVRLRRVEDPSLHTAMIYNTYGAFSPVLQILLPDKEGRFPGEPGCELEGPNVQPIP